MRRFLFRRLLSLIPTLLGIVIIVFLLVRLMPGDPVQTMLGIEGGDPELREHLARSLGLDRPIPVQLGIYLQRLAVGDLGNSIRTGLPVGEMIMSGLPNTLELSLVAFTISVVIAVPAGIISAVRRNSIPDTLIMICALIGISIPAFWLALLLIFAFAYSFDIFPISGMGAPLIDAVKYTVSTGDGTVLVGSLKRLVLPSITLGAVSSAMMARLTRSTLLEVLGQDYIRTAQAKGLAQRTVIYKHALRNAIIPIITVMALQLGVLLGGSVITETIFAWPGLGRMTVRAINQRDYPMIQGLVLAFAFIRVMLNVVADMLYGLVDPRIRYN